MKSKDIYDEQEIIKNLILKKKYKKLSEIYEDKIQKDNDDNARVELAKLILDGKIKIDNKKARELLMVAYRNHCSDATGLYAYMLVNGIGGEKKVKKGMDLFKREIKNGNPNPMCYIELEKYYKKINDKAVSKAFKKIYTYSEKRAYYSQVRKHKMCDNLAGRVINFIPNKFNVLFEEVNDEKRMEKLAKNMTVLYERAENKIIDKDNVSARYIYKRLSEYGDDEAKILYANMCSEGLGGRKDIQKSKELCENVINKYNLKLERINKKIIRINEIENYNQNKVYKSELMNLIKNKNSLMNNENYKNALLAYGCLLVDNFKKNDFLFEKGVKTLIELAKFGDKVVGTKKEYLNEISRKAMIKLGDLIESKDWKPTNVAEIKKIFAEFETGKEVKYASNVLDKLNGKKEYNKYEIKNNLNKKIYFFGIKKEFANLCFALNNKYSNKIARKIYTGFSNGGEHSCDDSLARLEQFGKGGSKNINLAKKHYVEFLDYSKNANDEEFLKHRAGVMSDYADLLVEENNIEMAIPLYKTACLYGITRAKFGLNNLQKLGKWYPVNNKEKELVKIRKIDGFAMKFSKSYNRKSDKYSINKHITQNEFYKSVATVMAAVMIGKGVSDNAIKHKEFSLQGKSHVEEYEK